MNRIILVFIFLLSCAKPRYVDGVNSTINNIGIACEIYFKTEDLCLSTKWEIMPSENSFGKMTFSFYHQDDSSLFFSPNNQPSILLWMPSMGHGSSPVTISFIEEGLYQASEIFFIMPGAWEIRFQLKDGNHHVVEEVIQNINI
jgi:hypothetical protein